MTRYAIVAALLLAACGSSEQQAGNDSEGETTATPIEQTPANLYVDPGNTVVPLDPPGNAAAPAAIVPTAPPSPVTAIPASFRGRWGIGMADCDASRDDNKGLMTVTADTLRFWESRAKLADARTEGPDTLVATFSFSGEGQTWREQTRMVLQDGGRTLIRDSGGDGQGGGQGGTSRYTRCPA